MTGYLQQLAGGSIEHDRMTGGKLTKGTDRKIQLDFTPQRNKISAQCFCQAPGSAFDQGPACLVSYCGKYQSECRTCQGRKGAHGMGGKPGKKTGCLRAMKIFTDQRGRRQNGFRTKTG